MTEIHVAASGEYDVIIEKGISKQIGEYARRIVEPEGSAEKLPRKDEKTGRDNSKNIHKAVIVSDDNVFPLYGKQVKSALEESGFAVSEFVFPAGEESKTLDTYGAIQEFLSGCLITRKDIMIALGGGVVGDLSGFAAATYMRGIRYIQVPTSLLAMVDSSVGGKTAVDLKHKKNQVGCFYQPSLVLCDIDHLETLPDEQYKSGCAEIIKYAVLGDEKLFDKLKEKPVSEQYEEVIATCVAMKRDIVEEDEFDCGKRQLLNLGHSVGHAIETLSNFEILHGQAVAAGMAVIARACVAKGICSAETEKQITGLLKKTGLPCNTDYKAKETAELMLNDKKMEGGMLNLILPEKIGRCKTEKVPASELEEWLVAGGLS